MAAYRKCPLTARMTPCGPQPAGWCSCRGSIPADCEACNRALTPGQRCQGQVYRRDERDESEVVLVHTRQRTDDETEQRSRGNQCGQMAGGGFWPIAPIGIERCYHRTRTSRTL